MAEPMIRRLLIANRGEIACRIQRTAHALGIETVAVHHAVDAGAPAVRAAHQAVELAGEPPVAAYLDGKAIIEAARQSGADAIHPGFGFLSENAAFAEAVIEAGLAWVGPEPETIRLMGDKQAARRFAATHDVPLAPSAEGDDPAALAARTAEIPLPLLVKAAAGGGGKGMRIVRSHDDLAAAIKGAMSEAERAFGDGRVYVERYVERPRHVEVQVLGDGRDVIHLGTRDCSIQRRFQKIVEEAPAPALSPELAQAIEATAVRLAAACNYRNAGTVEFIVAPDGAFFFLEMNTRLQVEHPVTEAITGVDLVAEQLHVAQGNPLRLGQSDIRFDGHAIEVRLYAEDADNGFVPAIGDVLRLQVPQGADLRFESGIAEGGAVTADFDPMLAKLIARGPDRAAAIRRMIEALDELQVLGVTTNQFFLRRVLDHAAFAEAAVHTGFLEQHEDDLRLPPLDGGRRALVMAVAAGLGAPPAFAEQRMALPYGAIGGWHN